MKNQRGKKPLSFQIYLKKVQLP